MAEIKGITGAKKKGSKDKGENRGEEIASVAYMKILLALSEGEIAGQFTGKNIYLDDTPLLDADGHENFPGVSWDWRSGTAAQEYIQGFPAVENELNIGTEIKSGTPWVKAFNNTQLSAVRLRIKFPNGVYTLRDSGGKDGYRIEFAVDISTDGSTYVEYGRDAADGIANTGYERSYRIDLPAATSGWQIRVRRLTDNKNDNKTADLSRIESITEIVDAKLRYPNTALLFVQFDSKLFDGRTPVVTVKTKGLVIRVPSNYNPITRTYNGNWDGTFKWAWTNNPAWIFYDLVLNKRYGLGKRISADQVDKWTLYQIGQYCDAEVSNGAGGKEARYLCDLYISQRTDAWTVLMDLANIFRGMISWSNNLLSVDADMPREMDPDFVFNKSNIVGSFAYSSTSERTNYSAAIVTYSNPDNGYQDDQASVFSQEISDRFGFNTIELSRIGCTRESEAQRHGAYAIETNKDDNGVEFKTGMEGRIPRVGKVIGISNTPMAGRQNGGRVAAVSGTKITLDRTTLAKTGDTLIINLPGGKSQGRKVVSASGRVLTVAQAYTQAPVPESGWVLDQSDLAIQQFRVKRIADNNDGTVTISGLPYNPNKFPRVDDGAVIEDRPVTVVPPRGQEAPENITVTSLYRVYQGAGITTMVATWSPVKNAIVYEMQWRRNNGDWINVPRTGNTRFEIDGIYAGRYVVRIRAINALDVASVWKTSAEVELTGKTGMPPVPVGLATAPLLHGVALSWGFPAGTDDTAKTELQYSPNPDGSGAMLLSDVAYPGRSYQQIGLQIGAIFHYRARIVDRLGNESPWTGWVQGMSSDDVGAYYDQLTDAIKDTDAWQEAQREIEQTQSHIDETASAIRDEVSKSVEQINKDSAANADEIKKNIDSQIAGVNQSVTDSINKVNKTIADGDAALDRQIKSAENGLKQSLAQTNTAWTSAVKQETTDRVADVNAKAAHAAEQLLAEKNERVAAIESTQQIIQDASESLAAQMAQISAGTGEQFDSLNIWYFDTSNEGWTEDDASNVPMKITDDGWLKAANSTASCRSPNGLTIDANAYRFIKMRIRRVGSPKWRGKLSWIGAGETGWSGSREMAIPEPDYDSDNIATITLHDIDWRNSGTVRRFRFDLVTGQNDTDYMLIDWIAVGRPTPGASTAALREESQARANADTAEASKRSTLAAQMRGSSESDKLGDLRSGLLFQEMNARLTADAAEVTARQSLQTAFNENKSAVSEELRSLSTEQSAQASKISGLESSLAKKADASALQSLTQKVDQQGDKLTSQGNALTSLTNRIGLAESGIAANSNAVSGLQSTVSKQGDTLSSIGQSITKLSNDLATTNENVGRKADASALQSLQNTVTQQGDKLGSQGSAITSLTNSLNQATRTGTNPWFDGSFESYDVDHKLSFDVSIVSGTSYLGTKAACFRRSANTGGNSDKDIGPDIAMRGGARYYIELWAMMPAGEEPPANWSTVFGFHSWDKSGGNKWDAADFTVREATLGARDTWVKFSGYARIQDNALKTRFWCSTRGQNGAGTPGYNLYVDNVIVTEVTEAMAAQDSANANASAISSLQSTVTQQGDTLSSQGSSITSLRNDLDITTQNLTRKADASALQSLQNTVTQQGKDITSNSESITSLANQVVNGKSNAWERRIYAVKLANAGTIPTFSHIQGRAPVQSDEVDDAVKLDFTSAGSYLIAHYKSLMYVSTETEIVIPQSNRVFDDTGAVYVNGVLILTGNSATQTFTLTLNPGWNTVEFLVHQWTGNAYLNFGLKFSEKVGKMFSGLGVNALSMAVSNISSNVSQTNDTLTSQGSAITKLTNDLATTNASINKKADASALQSLQNTVTEQGNRLESQSSSITSLTNSFNSLSVSGLNLIKKSGSMDGWTFKTADTYRGNAVTGITLKAGAGYKDLREEIIDAPVDGSEYVYSFYARAGSDGQAMNVYFYNPNTTTSSENNLGVKSTKQDGQNTFRLTTAWARYWVKWKQTPGTGTKRLILGRIEASATAEQSVYISSPKLETGNTPTAWSPAPGDMATGNDLNGLKTAVDANSSAIQSVTSRIQSAEDKVTSQGTAITRLENNLTTVSGEVAKKADASALQSLQNTVTQQGESIAASNASTTQLQASLNRRTVFTATARGNGTSAAHGFFDEHGNRLFLPSRNYNIITFKKQTDGSTAIDTATVYDAFGGKDAADRMVADIAAMASGTYVCVMTFDEPTGGRGYIRDALATLGGTIEVINALPYRGAYILLGRKGLKPGDGLEVSAPGGNGPEAIVSTAVEFVNGVMMGLGTSAGVMMKSAANASAITTLQNSVTQHGNDISSISSRTTALENGLSTVNGQLSNKADASALQSLQNTVTQQGKDLASQSGSLTSLNNSLTALNGTVNDLAADGDIARQFPGNMLANASFERGTEGYTVSKPDLASAIDAKSPHTGARILALSAGQTSVSQAANVVSGRSYKIGVFARRETGSVISNQSNNKLRIGATALLYEVYIPAALPVNADWMELSGTWKATLTGAVDVSINSSLSAGLQYFDDFYFIDVTDQVANAANSSAINNLTSRVTSAENTISSQSTSLTSLRNDLTSLSGTVSKKADSSALQTLQNTVTEQNGKLTALGSSVTSLESNLSTLKAQSNPWLDGTFETYTSGQQLGGGTAVVTGDAHYSGARCLKVTRPANTNGNADKTIGPWSAVRGNARYRVEFWVMMPAGENPPANWSASVGLHSVNKDGGNDWQGLNINEKTLGSRDTWVKISGVIKTSPTVTRSHVWISVRGPSGAGTPGYNLYIDDMVYTDVTDAADALAATEANAKAITSMDSKVTDLDGKVTAQASQLTSMSSKVDSASSKVDQMAQTLSDSEKTQSSLNSTLQSQIDAQASANIVNQGALDDTIKSVATIQNTQKTQATEISSIASQQTTLSSKIGDLSSAVQTQAETVAELDGKVSSSYSIKVETNNGKKVGAGIVMGSNGETSDMILYADRFSLFNRNNATAVPVMIAEGNELFIDSARIKNGSINNAKVGDLQSSNYVAGRSGWRFPKDGNLEINGNSGGNGRMVINGQRLDVYDDNNVLRVRIGLL